MLRAMCITYLFLPLDGFTIGNEDRRNPPLNLQVSSPIRNEKI